MALQSQVRVTLDSARGGMASGYSGGPADGISPIQFHRRRWLQPGPGIRPHAAHRAFAPRAFVLLLAAAAALAPAHAAWAQQRTAPEIGYVYPAGGQAGTTFEVAVGGQNLGDANAVHLSGSGVKATIIEVVKPVMPGQASTLRERLQELMQGSKDANAFREIDDIRKKLAIFLKKPASPAIAETVRLRIDVAPDAEAGPRELRLETPAGLSNPRTFQVGQLAEFSEKAATSIEDAGTLKDLKRLSQPRSVFPPSEMRIKLPAVVNGQVMPGGVNRYRFDATKGQRLVAAACARELIPYLADAVPGWFQAALTLYDANGNELAYADHFRFHPDPVLTCEIPRDGQYLLEIRDSIYRGREDFVYRVSIGELPFVTDVFPLGAKAGASTTARATGWNLPAAPLDFDATGKAPGTYSLAAHNGPATSNRVPFAVDDLPEITPSTSNTSQASAQTITLPVVINGRVDKPGQWRVYRFEGKSGQQVVAEVLARRLGSPLDSLLKLTDANGAQLAFNDDHEDAAAALLTHQADSYLTATLGADGTYYLHLGDAQHQGGPEYAYRLRVSPPRPDFELRVWPSSISARPGACVPVTVTALRKDGFSGPIALSLKGAPAGTTLGGAELQANQDQVRITLTAPPSATAGPLPLCLQGQATIAGTPVVRTAVAAENMMQAFAFHHLVPALEFDLTVPPGPLRPAVNILSETPVRIPVGGSVRISLGVPLRMAYGQVDFELDQPPEGISIQKVIATPGHVEIVVQSDRQKVKAGLKANLIIGAFVTPNAPASQPASAASSPATRPTTLAASSPAARPATLAASSSPTSRPGALAEASSPTSKPAASSPTSKPTTLAASSPTSQPASKPQMGQRRWAWGFLPAVPFEIVAAPAAH